jgi:hypothetical protein
MSRDSVESVFAALSGREILGGCDACDAYQTMSGGDGVFMLTVHHDEGCPFLAQREAR